MTRNYNTLTNIVKENKDNRAYFSCMKCLLEFEKIEYPSEKKASINFYLDSAVRLPNAALIFILYGCDFSGWIKKIDIKRENTTAIVDFDSRYSSVLDTKLLINSELCYHWRVITNGHYDQQIYWDIKRYDNKKIIKYIS